MTVARTTAVHEPSMPGPQAADAGGARAPVALVTGAARGIGLEVAAQLAARGWTVVLSARTQERAAAAASIAAGASATASAGDAEGGGRVVPVALDVTDEVSVRAAVSALDATLGRLDVLVNNAAAYADWQETASAADLASARAVLEANLFGPWRVTQACLPLLRRSATPERPARVVMVASAAGSHGDAQFGLATGPGVASYGVSKAALLALTTKLAVELRDAHVLVNAVDPGLTATAPGMEAMGARPVADGAKSVLWAATLGADGPSGGFYRDGAPLPW